MEHYTIRFLEANGGEGGPLEQAAVFGQTPTSTGLR